MTRPTIAKSMLVSFIFHMTAFAATAPWWTEPVERLLFVGDRQVIQIESLFVPAQDEGNLSDVVELALARELSSVVTPSSTPAARRPVAELRPQDVSVPRQVLSQELVRDKLPENVRLGASESAVSRNTMTNRAPEPARELVRVEPERPVVELEPALRPRRAAPQVPSSVGAARQIAGTENERAPDFSGNVPPQYPAEAVRQRIEGTVVLRLRIDAEGYVTSVTVHETSGSAILDRVAVSAVRGWRGRPAMRAGRPTASEEFLPIRFRMQDGSSYK